MKIMKKFENNVYAKFGGANLVHYCVVDHEWMNEWMSERMKSRVWENNRRALLQYILTCEQ